MKLTLGQNTYYITFHHHRDDRHPNRRVTEAYVSRRITQGGIERFITVAFGAAILNPKDVESGEVHLSVARERGRRLALDRALRGTTPRKTLEMVGLDLWFEKGQLGGGIPDRELRRALWTVYHMRGALQAPKETPRVEPRADSQPAVH